MYPLLLIEFSNDDKVGNMDVAAEDVESTIHVEKKVARQHLSPLKLFPAGGDNGN